MNKLRTTLKLSLITPLLLVICVFPAGGGHGTYIPAIIFFPFGLISFILFDELITPFIILAILQFPLYGILLDYNIGKGKKRLIINSICIAHIVLTIVIFLFKADNL